MAIDLEEICAICSHPRGKHWIGDQGRGICPIQSHFTPCKHERQHGTGTISTDGTGSPETVSVKDPS